MSNNNQPDLLQGLVLEHICIPSEDPVKTAEFLTRYGAEVVVSNPQGPVFVRWLGQMIEFVKVTEIGLSIPTASHIAIRVPVLRQAYDLASALVDPANQPPGHTYSHVPGKETTYFIVIIPGRVALQIIYRDKDLGTE